jgi:Tol biopolymer transport system component
LKWVIFNSDRSGGPQVYCAAIPLEMITELEDDA